MRRFFLSVIGTVLLLAMIPVNALANEKSNIDNNIFKMLELTIQVLPEYAYHFEDEEKKELPVLYGYHGSLKNVSDEPQKGIIEIPLPMDSKGFKISYVADYNRDLTQRLDVNFDIDEERQVIRWQTSDEVQPEEHYKFVIEFYTSDIEVDGKKREINYTFDKFADIDMLNILFIEPLKAEKFDLSPAADAHQQNQHGLNMFHYQVKDIEAGEEFKINLNYERDEELMTVELLDKMRVEMPNSSEAETKSMGLKLIVIGSTSGVAIILLVLFLQKRSSSNRKDKAVNKDSNKATNEDKIARLRKMLVDGEITEEEYEELLTKIGGGK